MSDFEVMTQVINDVGTFSLLLVIVVAFLKGWVTPAITQARLDKLQEDFEQKLAEKLKEYTDLQDRYREAVVQLQERRISDLEELLRERQQQVESGMQMLLNYQEVQDKVAKLADLVKDSDE